MKTSSSAVPAVVVPSSAVAVPAETTPAQDFGALVPVRLAYIGDTIMKSQVVDAHDLYEFLGVKSRFADWVRVRINEFGFAENVDYMAVSENLVNGGKRIGYILSLNMAKELAMLERNEKGRQARLYFIECEKQLIIELQRGLPYRQHIPLDCTTRPLIKTRAQLSFRTTDEAGNAVMALADCRAAWDVPRGLSPVKAKQTGKAYFAELQELAEQNPEEAKDALIELFLFGWRTPMQIKQPKATESVGMGDGRQVTVLKKDAWVNPDVVRDYEVEWSFLTALAGSALGGGA